MAILIVDSKTAATGIHEGILLCIDAVIPALFPFMVLSVMISSFSFSYIEKIMLPIQKLCGIPKGTETLFLIGILGGYPTGAQLITQARKNKKISLEDAQRMLGFYNNAGPAFIFGIGASLLPTSYVWGVWFVHILSAILVGALLPGKSKSTFQKDNTTEITLPDALLKSVKTMGIICGWIVLFRMVTKFLCVYLLSGFPENINYYVNGMIELTNGILLLRNISIQGARFIYFSSFLSFGGLCVAAQTLSITKNIGAGLYFPGKIMQGCISFLLSYVLQFVLFAGGQIAYITISQIIFIMIVLLCSYLLTFRKKTVAFARLMMYNKPRFHT